MPTQEYSASQHWIETLLTWFKSIELAIPASLLDGALFEYRDSLVGRRRVIAIKSRDFCFSLQDRT